MQKHETEKLSILKQKKYISIQNKVYEFNSFINSFMSYFSIKSNFDKNQLIINKMMGITNKNKYYLCKQIILKKNKLEIIDIIKRKKLNNLFDSNYFINKYFIYTNIIYIDN